MVADSRHSKNSLSSKTMVVRTNIIRKLLKTHLQKAFGLRPGRFPGIAGNAGNNGKDGKFHKSD